ncbi:MAG: hypothetical protein HC930_08740 [Hydrococcus sp. SU_1_0]|nr:hypothetical protein [Hydrococcus sp. SU_1_0]
MLDTVITAGCRVNPPVTGWEAHLIDPSFNYSSSNQTLGDFAKTFAKETNDAIEVLPSPGKPNKLIVWLVKLNSQGGESSRAKIFAFESHSGQAPPQYSVTCGEGCPPGTCQVDCDTVFCCYDTATGKAVSSFNKQ